MVAPPAPRRITLTAAVDEYAQHLARQALAGAISTATLDTKERDIAELVKLVGGKIADAVTSRDLDDAILAYQGSPDARYTRTAPPDAGRSVATARRWYGSISAFFAWCEREAIVQASPVPGMAAKPRSREPLRVGRTALTRETAEALLDAPIARKPRRSDQDSTLRDQVLLHILFETGLRVGELVALRREDVVTEVDTSGRSRVWLIVRSGKGGKSRRVPVTATTAEMLSELTASAPPDVEGVFLSWRGHPISSRDVQRLLERMRDQLPAELRRDVTPHALRHTMATLMLSSGAADIAVVQRLLGHASLATTGRYLDEVREELAAAVDRNPVTGGN